MNVGAASADRSRVGAWVYVPLVLLVGAQLALFAWMSRRGYEFTDEAFYLLNYLHWRELVGLVSFFGFYLEWPFRAFGQSIAAMRGFGLLLLVASAGWTAQQVLTFARSPGASRADVPHWPFVAAACATALYHFSYLTTLRLPSYNTLVLCAALVSTGLLLRTRDEPRWPGLLAYGVLLGVCGLTKATSGLLLAFAHLLFFAAVNRDWRAAVILRRVALALAGVAINVALLTLVDPDWIRALQGGAAIFAYDSESKIMTMIDGISWDVQRLVPQLALAVALAVPAVAFFFIARRGVSLAVVVVVAAVAAVMLWRAQPKLWLPVSAIAVGVLWLAEVATRSPRGLRREDLDDAALSLLLLVLPLVFSFGTAMPVLEHSRGAAVAAMLALLLRLERLAAVGRCDRWAVAVALAALCVPTLWLQIGAARDVSRTYRQSSALAAQAIETRIGAAPAVLLVDAPTRRTLAALATAAQQVGLERGQPMLDFTGEGPGLVAALDGRPLGVAWLVGGYRGSAAWAEQLLGRLPPRQIEQAWILASADNPRAIPGWQALVAQRLGPGSHELAATIEVLAPSRWKGGPPVATLQIWRPLRAKRDAAT